MNKQTYLYIYIVSSLWMLDYVTNTVPFALRDFPLGQVGLLEGKPANPFYSIIEWVNPHKLQSFGVPMC